MPVLAAEGLPASDFVRCRDATLVLDGRPLRIVSVNKYDLFAQFVMQDARPLPPDSRQKAIEALDELAAHGLTLIRVNGSPYWPGWWQRAWFDADPAEQARKQEVFLSRFDDMVDACRQRGIYLVVSLCWYVGNLADLGHHDLHEGITNPSSAARQRVEQYIRRIVQRYCDDPTIALWEIGNEWNLTADLQAAEGVLRHVPESLAPGPVVRDKRNNYTSDELAECVRRIALLIKSIDGNHLVTTGHSAPRPAAMHLLRAARTGRDKDWTPDSEAELEEYLRLSHPDPVDVISIHFYDEAMSALGKPPCDVSNIAAYQRLARRIGKPLFIGEIGLCESVGRDYASPEAVDLVRRQCAALRTAGVPIALYWTFRDESDRIDPMDGEYQLRYGRTDTVLDLMAAYNISAPSEVNRRRPRPGSIR